MTSSPVAAPPRPRFRLHPPRVESDAQRAIDLAALAGLHLDPWQQDALDAMLGIDAAGKWAARSAALICPRQNGKGAVLEALELYWLFLCPEDRLIVHTAHRFDTSQDHFKRIASLVDNTPTLRKRVKAIRVANGSEGIELLDGSRLLFKARSKGGIRGLSPDKVALDEAFYLWDEAVQAILPAQAARPNPQTVYASSSPIDGPESEFLRRLCLRGRVGDPTLAYIEYSAAPGSDLDDEALWRDVNPSLGDRLLVATLRANRTMMTDEAFGAEHLGIWTEAQKAAGAIDLSAWSGLQVPTADADWLAGEVCFGIEGPPSGDYVSVVAAGMVGDRVGIELAKREPGTEWLLPWAVEANERRRPKGFVFDPKSATADAHMAAFRAAGLPVIECGFADRALPQATIGINDDIHNDRLRVLSHPLFDAAVEGAERRYLGESWLWNRKAGVDPTPLVAATLARWGLLLPIEAAPEPFFFYAD